jgi:hypothetical protein
MLVFLFEETKGYKHVESNVKLSVKVQFSRIGDSKIKVNMSFPGCCVSMLNLFFGYINTSYLKSTVSQLNTVSSRSTSNIENTCLILWMKQRHDLLTSLTAKCVSSSSYRSK